MPKEKKIPTVEELLAGTFILPREIWDYTVISPLSLDDEAALHLYITEAAKNPDYDAEMPEAPGNYPSRSGITRRYRLILKLEEVEEY